MSDNDKQHRPLAEVEARRMIALKAVKAVKGVDDSDPRKESALRYYEAQLAELDAEIEEITGKPPPIVVGLKTASLLGDARLSKEE
jgi:hypothetical protein